MKAPILRQALRSFALAAFSLLARDVEEGAELGFAFEEHRSPGRPPLYDYRALVQPFVDAREERLARLPDAAVALADVQRQPGAGLFARAHARAGDPEERGLFRTVVLPVVTKTAEACGGFDWHEAAFDRAYAELERSLFAERRSYAALAPLVGLSAGTPVDLGDAMRIRMAEPAELSAGWPQASALLPERFGREPDRACLLEVEYHLRAEAAEPPDAPAEIADAVTSIRLATGGAVASGPVLFERLDGRPYGVRPVVPIASTSPAGDPARLDPFRAGIACEVLRRLEGVERDPDLAEALDRWELALFQDEPFRSDQLRASLAAALGGRDGVWAAALRAAVLVGEKGHQRAAHFERLRALAVGVPANAAAADAVRRALVETLLHGERTALIAALDDSLFGLRPRPTAQLGVCAATG